MTVTFHQETLVHPTPTLHAKARITIGHVQLRDLIVCPTRRGVLNYISGRSLVQRDFLVQDSAKVIAKLEFEPNCIASGSGILAAGGQSAELHISPLPPLSPASGKNACQAFKPYSVTLPGSSINNALLIDTVTSPMGALRIFVSNNDCTVKVFEVGESGNGARRLKGAGFLKLGTAVNHASISPDGRTLLAVGDTNQVFLYNISTGADTVTFDKIATYGAGADANFSTAFSADGSKFAVASQDGLVTVWDVRSSSELAVYRTAPRPVAGTHSSAGLASSTGISLSTHRVALNGGVSHARDTSLWDANKGLGHGVRALKFSPLGAERELLVFTEHTNNLHAIDARTFTSHSILPVPSISPSAPSSPTSPTSPLVPASSSFPPPLRSVNLAGVCFDPTGKWIYVGTEKSVLEYEVAAAGRIWEDAMWA
ncbi:hypothetical protein BOTBODRAFT_171937 [Botryobasidium botryosum FD-172 SS1]|uniref:DUF2415 domain-containing protein n=1 Tax=Botryobasidium botryosum (strain FD-172 SS1) TaxID=930990 RepID=A0A067N103_BOTB1|nr:hypothetical protein BOTBODRAFT_171937 [Botryobasidium botryosum FD-172 SS1]